MRLLTPVLGSSSANEALTVPIPIHVDPLLSVYCQTPFVALVRPTIAIPLTDPESTSVTAVPSKSPTKSPGGDVVSPLIAGKVTTGDVSITETSLHRIDFQCRGSQRRTESGLATHQGRGGNIGGPAWRPRRLIPGTINDPHRAIEIHVGDITNFG